MNNKPLNNTTPTFNNKVVVSGNKVVSKEKIRYKYIAFDKNGKQIKGYFDAFRKSDVESFLTVQGYKIAEIKPTKITKIGKFLTFSNEMRYKELTFFLTQLSTYIKSGITLADTIAILEKQTNKKKNKELFKRISYELNTGANFSEALARQGNVFPKLLINMLKASELTGNLTETLDDMAAYYKTADSNRKQIISALTYPSVVLVIAIIVLTFLLIFVVPQFESIFEQLGSKLPIMTHDINTWLCFGQFLEKGKQSKLSIKIDNRIKEWNKNYTDKELEVMITSIFNVFEKNNIKSFRELKKLKWNQIIGMINEVNDIDDETKKLYSETIKDLIWLNNKKVS